ncbi:nitrous oxide reductase accessory protein NosL [Malaciobacter marinus]|jgi:nitrous oxide reductase accessory protein NosL|uniref:nitrous oxide reductase accessory protein NosL n=1 Tax=Malaciobacter marinus TaxID=505249 RepID=UPI0009A6DF83|nr:nitrous oxide reductase accessory protein NosL [Malaciobacter marinus]SKB42709.1 Nitrous oxide reductase accessory protein NosL [Malaciobacter marinus]
MKKYLLLLTIFSCLIFAKSFQSIKKDEGTFINEGSNKYYCSSCAMSLPKHYKTNYIYNNRQYCSIHCLYEQTKGKFDSEIKVVDTNSLKFIDAKKAFFVIGSNKPATMSFHSKYAFKQKKDALDFISKNGGNLVEFEDLIVVVRNDFLKDLSMLDTKKKKKVYKVGKKLYESNCNKISIENIKTITDLKTKLKEFCKVNKDKQLQAMTVYLWDTKKLDKTIRKIESIDVPKDAKCVICGMFVHKYPKWTTMLEYKQKHYYFDGPKDMLKFVFQKGKNNIGEIYVSDYFTTKKIDARKAFYVMGSDVYGPMGKELVAFESDQAAYNFKNDHFGKKVMFFSEITDEVLEYLK